MSPGESKRSRHSSARGPGSFGVALVLLVIVGAGLLFFLTTNPKQAVQAEPKKEQEQVNPFADLPPEAPPEKRAKSKAQLQREQQEQAQQQAPPK